MLLHYQQDRRCDTYRSHTIGVCLDTSPKRKTIVFATTSMRFIAVDCHEGVSPVNLVVGSREGQAILVRADGEICDGAHVALDMKRLQQMGGVSGLIWVGQWLHNSSVAISLADVCGAHKNGQISTVPA